MGHSKAETYSPLCKYTVENVSKEAVRFGYSQNLQFFSCVHIWIVEALIFFRSLLLLFLKNPGEVVNLSVTQQHTRSASAFSLSDIYREKDACNSAIFSYGL